MPPFGGQSSLPLLSSPRDCGLRCTPGSLNSVLPVQAERQRLSTRDHMRASLGDYFRGPRRVGQRSVSRSTIDSILLDEYAVSFSPI